VTDSFATVPPVAADAKRDAPAPISLSARGLMTVLAIVGLADWLFYGHWIGISLVVFLIALAIATAFANPIAGRRGEILLGAAVLVTGLLPYAVRPSLLAFLFAAGATAYFAVALSGKAPARVADRASATTRMLLDCGWRPVVDICRALVGRSRTSPLSLSDALIVWIVPVTLGSLFLLLFTGANPLIEQWMALLEPNRLAAHIDLARCFFWLLILLLAWPFIFLRIRQRSALRQRKPTAASDSGSSLSPALLGKAAVLRSLIVFNALFAMQTILDGLYLWGGVALPDGMSYASYAHRGAYPLIVTALLAAGFVIVALRPGSATERSPLIRALVYLWIAQNVWLVISSILRLDLYVAVYSLTYWRVAAFVWMVLVAIGLVLILTRIVRGYSNRWLVGANLVSLALVLYGCSLANFASIIARYNVRQSFELTGQEAKLDVRYLFGLGDQAIPAVDELIARPASAPNSNNIVELASWRETLASEHRTHMQDWRAWSYWDWRLAQYLDRMPRPTPPQ